MNFDDHDCEQLEYLNYTSFSFVKAVQKWIEDTVGGNAQVPVRYWFHHNQLSEEEKMIRKNSCRDSLQKCANTGFGSCGDVVHSLASVGQKDLGLYLTDILSRPNNIKSYDMMTYNFGFESTCVFYESIKKKKKYEELFRKEHFRIEAGGGSGAGFQIYCNDTFLATAGGGGGGGIEGNIHKQHQHSLGGGGGGGAQISRSVLSQSEQITSQEWISVGGGSGCGTCSTEALCAQSPVHILCGTALDDNLPSASTSDLFAAHLKEKIRSCHATGLLRVEGGGGGGGGTSECCLQVWEGYGFAFSLGYQSSFDVKESAEHSTHHSNNIHTDSISASNAQSFAETSPSNANVGDEHFTATLPAHLQEQYKYDLFGYLLYNASKVCKGGYGNWTCCCDEAKSVMQQQPKRFAQIKLWFLHVSCKQQSNEANGTAQNASDSTRPFLGGAGGWTPFKHRLPVDIEPSIPFISCSNKENQCAAAERHTTLHNEYTSFENRLPQLTTTKYGAADFVAIGIVCIFLVGFLFLIRRFSAFLSVFKQQTKSYLFSFGRANQEARCLKHEATRISYCQNQMHDTA